MPAKDDGPGTFLRPAQDLLAAGYFIYGPQTALLITFGAGVLHFVLDPVSGTFRLVDGHKRIPARACEFAINA